MATEEAQKKIRDLETSVAQLEGIVHSNREVVKQLLSLGDFQAKFRPDQDAAEILAVTSTHLRRMASFTTLAFLLVDESDYDFKLVTCDPEPDREGIEKEIAHHTKEGTFSWALSQNRSVLVAGNHYRDTVMFHRLESNSRILGMFCGVLEDDETTLDDTVIAMLSVIFFIVAHALENAQLYRKLGQYNQNLEKRIAEKTQSLEEALVHANSALRAKSEFIANVSHEIRTPMNGILGLTDIVLGTDLGDEQRECLLMVKESAVALLDVLNDILDFSRIRAGRLELVTSTFDLLKHVQSIARLHRASAEKKGLKLTTSVADDVPERVRGDVGRLRQVLTNLLNNAIKFTREGSVSLRVQTIKREGGRAKLHFAVEDTGIGIPDEKKGVIFESFSQVDGTITREFGGTGLGLTIASNIVHLMDGHIWVESKVDSGSAFHFTVCLELPKSSDP